MVQLEDGFETPSYLYSGGSDGNTVSDGVVKGALQHRRDKEMVAHFQPHSQCIIHIVLLSLKIGVPC